jgi:hypothetical protein
VCRSSLCARTADATEHAGQKIVLQRQLADLGVQGLDVGAGITLVRCRREDLGSALEQLGSTLANLVRVASNCSASSTRVLSPRIAAGATFALNVAESFRRGRFICSSAMRSPIRAELQLIRLPISRSHLSRTTCAAGLQRVAGLTRWALLLLPLRARPRNRTSSKGLAPPLELRVNIHLTAQMRGCLLQDYRPMENGQAITAQGAISA